MAKSSLSLERLLSTPQLDRIVPRLSPDVLLRVIDHYGLDDCAELVALASPAQISRLLDEDVWRPTCGSDETFDVDRFGVWLTVLMQSGVARAAGKLVGLDPDLVIAGISGHILVFDQAAVSAYVSLEGDYVAGRVSQADRTSEIGGYMIEARRLAGWDVVIDLLTFLEEEHRDYFRRLMRGCVERSSGAREADGCHDLLEDAEQHLFDLVSARTDRRDASGYLSAQQARAFFESAVRMRLDTAAPPTHALARAYFRALDATPISEDSSVDAAPAADVDDGPTDAAVTAVVELLADAGVLGNGSPRLLGAARAAPGRRARVEAHVLAHPEAAEELAYLANAVMAGARIQDRAFTPKEASDAATATCNLGLERWPDAWHRRDLITAFQIGWQSLHRDVSMHTAQQLHALLPSLRGPDRLVQLRLAGLRMRLARAIADATPFVARDQLDVLLPFGNEAWAGLVALLDEWPVTNAAITGALAGPALDPTAFDFIAGDDDIAAIHRFVERLPRALG